MRLHHFTCPLWLPGILREGLNRGDVPLTVDTGINAVCLTTNVSPPTRALANGRPGVYDKKGVRIAVDVDAQDPALVRWKEFPKLFFVDTRFYRVLNKGIDGNPVYDWYIYLGTILPGRFVEVRDSVSGISIPFDSWPAIMARPMPQPRRVPGVRVLAVCEALRHSESVRTLKAA